MKVVEKSYFHEYLIRLFLNYNKKVKKDKNMSKIIIKNRYATIPNKLLNNIEISLKAKGLFGFLQSKPDGWSFSKEKISKQTKEGLTSIKSAFKELKDFGYLETIPIKSSDNKFEGYDYILCGFPQGGKQDRRETGRSGNHTAISKKEYSKKEYSKKDLVGASPTRENKVLDSGLSVEETVLSGEVIPDLLVDKKRHIQIIGLFAQFKGVVFTGKEHMEIFIRRNVKPARKLNPYPDEKIIATMAYLEQNADFKWTMETILKYIDEDLEKIGKRNKIVFG